MGFTGKTGFTFKFLHGAKMSETVGDIELSRYVVQVLEVNIHLIVQILAIFLT